MKIIKILLISASLIGLSIPQLQAQEKTHKFTISTGFASKVIDESYGGHLGINYANTQAKAFTTDAQLSVSMTQDSRTSSTWFGINALYGGRLYFNAPEKSFRFFGNMLAGPAFTHEIGDDFIENQLRVGYSVGVYLQAKRYLLGAAIESPENLLIKIGYSF